MKYQFDKYQWATLILRVKGVFACGNVPAVTRLMESGINLPVMVRGGKVVTTDGTPVEALESVELEVDDAVEFEGRSAKEMRARHDRLARFIHAIDETGDISPEDLMTLTRHDKNGNVTQLPPPAIRKPEPAVVVSDSPPRPPESGELARLQDEVRFLKDMSKTYEDRLNDLHKRLQTAEQSLGEARQKAVNQQQLIGQTRTELAELREKSASLPLAVENLGQANSQAFSALQDRLQEIEQAVAGIVRSLRTKQAVDQQVKDLRKEQEDAR